MCHNLPYIATKIPHSNSCWSAGQHLALLAEQSRAMTSISLDRFHRLKRCKAKICAQEIVAKCVALPCSLPQLSVTE